MQQTTLNIPDATGLLWMARMTGQRLPERVTGVDTVEKLCLSLHEEHPVFVLGGRNGVGQCAMEKLKQRNPHLNIAGTYEGNPSDDEALAIIQKINAVKPHILFVAYGAPKQDLWIHKYLSELSSVRLAMGVGGSFDFLSGSVRRAPGVFRMLGLEWLWRLLMEPWRLKRILTAVIVFPLMVLRYGRSAPHS